MIKNLTNYPDSGSATTERGIALYLNAMLEAVKLPTRVSDLDSGLTNVDRDTLSHFLRRRENLKDDDEENFRKSKLRLLRRNENQYRANLGRYRYLWRGRKGILFSNPSK